MSNDLVRLRKLYEAGLQDTFIDTALRKVVDYQTSRNEADLQHVQEVLAEYENRYGLNSDEFWRHYTNGTLEDTADYMEWNVFYKMRIRILSRLSILRDNDTNSIQ